MDKPHQVIIERTYQAPIARVWQAWTDPTLLKQWWGPDNVSIAECTVDLRVGGEFNIVMEAGAAMGPYKGTRWPMQAKFTEVEPQAKLAYSAKAWTEGQKEGTMLDQSTVITFADVNGATKVTVKATIHQAGPMAGMAVQGMETGFTQQLAKLDRLVTQ